MKIFLLTLITIAVCLAIPNTLPAQSFSAPTDVIIVPPEPVQSCTETTSWWASDGERYASYSVSRTFIGGVLNYVDSILSAAGPGVGSWGTLPLAKLWGLASRYATNWGSSTSKSCYEDPYGGGKG